uniref:Uncharacterized protein n=1 Tax=Cacopsylla melanoneura TaxID=428564 RepID=A0A8D8WB88_9HEMI
MTRYMSLLKEFNSMSDRPISNQLTLWTLFKNEKLTKQMTKIRRAPQMKLLQIPGLAEVSSPTLSTDCSITTKKKTKCPVEDDLSTLVQLTYCPLAVADSSYDQTTLLIIPSFTQTI